jgi:hypothetical protein
MTRDMRAKWRTLDDACRAPGWSVRKISDWIEGGRLRWRGYSQALRKNVTSDTFPRDFTAKIDPGSRMHITLAGPPRGRHHRGRRGSAADIAASKHQGISGRPAMEQAAFAVEARSRSASDRQEI